jgi:hypothetical protein
LQYGFSVGLTVIQNDSEPFDQPLNRFSISTNPQRRWQIGAQF